MVVNCVNEDIIILGVNVVSKIVIEKDCEWIDMVIVGIEFGIDYLKVSVVIIYYLLKI